MMDISHIIIFMIMKYPLKFMKVMTRKGAIACATLIIGYPRERTTSSTMPAAMKNSSASGLSQTIQLKMVRMMLASTSCLVRSKTSVQYIPVSHKRLKAQLSSESLKTE